MSESVEKCEEAKRGIALAQLLWHDSRRRVPYPSLLSIVFLLNCDEKKPVQPPPTASAPSASAPSVAPISTPSAAASAPIPDRIGCQHILVAYKGAKNAPSGVNRSKAEAKARAEKLLQDAKASKDFAALAKDNSDDPGSATRNGSVGKFKRDEMTKPFSDAAFKLQVDEVSPVTESAFGFHVIKRFE
jgi:peptidyl-prolyl cis-trans isomerase NIMA-interacting 1